MFIRSLKNRSYEFLYNLFLLPKNIYFNFRVLPVNQAIKLPLYVNYGVKLVELHKNVIHINSPNLKKYMISFGRGGSGGIAKLSGGIINLKKDAYVEFKGSAYFHEGVRIWLDEKAKVIFGNDFSANKNFVLFYNDELIFGNSVMIGWNVEIIDGNGHIVIENNESNVKNCKIIIGNHVWIGSYVSISRSTIIGDNCIVAYGSRIVKGNFADNVLIGGYPAVEIKKNINWEK